MQGNREKSFARHKTIQIEPALPVSVIGYPFGHFEHSGWPLWATGHIASEPSRAGQFDQIFIDCRSREGQSGAPVYVKYFRDYRDATGQDISVEGNIYSLVGLYSGRINSESDLGIVWTAAQLNHACWNLQADQFAPLPDDSAAGAPLPKIKAGVAA